VNKKGSSHKPSAASAKFTIHQTQDPTLSGAKPKLTKKEHEREARKSQIAYEVEKSVERKVGPMKNIKGDYEEAA
jgi:hypothetical protein